MAVQLTKPMLNNILHEYLEPDALRFVDLIDAGMSRFVARTFLSVEDVTTDRNVRATYKSKADQRGINALLTLRVGIDGTSNPSAQRNSGESHYANSLLQASP